MKDGKKHSDKPASLTRRCWEYKNCGREKTMDCPAIAQESDKPCWSVAGTMCDGDVQGTFAKKLLSCLECGYYLAQTSQQSRGDAMVMPASKLPGAGSVSSVNNYIVRVYRRDPRSAETLMGIVEDVNAGCSRPFRTVAQLSEMLAMVGGICRRKKHQPVNQCRRRTDHLQRSAL